MNTIFMNSKNSKLSDRHRLLVNLTNKINLTRSCKYATLSNPSLQYTWKNIKKSYKNNKFKISSPTWNEEFELLDGSYSISEIQDYFEYILKEHLEKINDNNISIEIYLNEIGNKMTFKIKQDIILNF